MSPHPHCKTKTLTFFFIRKQGYGFPNHKAKLISASSAYKLRPALVDLRNLSPHRKYLLYSFFLCLPSLLDSVTMKCLFHLLEKCGKQEETTPFVPKLFCVRQTSYTFATHRLLLQLRFPTIRGHLPFKHYYFWATAILA